MNLDETVKHFLLDILRGHLGHENRIRRGDLRLVLIARLGAKIGDRKMRDLLEELRSEERGCWICGSRQAGYFTAKDENELRQFLAADKRLISKLAARIRNQEKFAGLKNPDQMQLLHTYAPN